MNNEDTKIHSQLYYLIYLRIYNLYIFSIFIATTALERDQLPKPPRTVASDMDGNPPLYITRNRNGDIYVNNARLVPSRSVTVMNGIGKKQVSINHIFT